MPPGLGEDHALRADPRQLLGDDGYEVEFDDTVVGNRSPIDTPLMDSIRASSSARIREPSVAPIVLPGFCDSRWCREAFPDCVAYGFFPQRTMDLLRGASR